MEGEKISASSMVGIRRIGGQNQAKRRGSTKTCGHGQTKAMTKSMVNRRDGGRKAASAPYHRVSVCSMSRTSFSSAQNIGVGAASRIKHRASSRAYAHSIALARRAAARHILAFSIALRGLSYRAQ